jgi:hypothetical protein
MPKSRKTSSKQQSKKKYLGKVESSNRGSLGTYESNDIHQLMAIIETRVMDENNKRGPGEDPIIGFISDNKVLSDGLYANDALSFTEESDSWETYYDRQNGKWNNDALQNVLTIQKGKVIRNSNPPITKESALKWAREEGFQ